MVLESERSALLTIRRPDTSGTGVRTPLESRPSQVVRLKQRGPLESRPSRSVVLMGES